MAEEAIITILSNLPGIGPILAIRLLEHFSSLRKIFLASKPELSLVKGVGRARAGKIGVIMDAALERGKDDLQAKLRS
jgi:ERCC4-type nuclease